MTITVYTQPACQPCKATKRWLDRRGIMYRTVDLTESPDDMAAVKALGYAAAPVIVVSGRTPRNGPALARLHSRPTHQIHNQRNEQLNMSIPTISDIAGVIADPELKHTNSGKAILNLRLAFNDSKYNEETRTWDNTKTFYVDAQAWEQTAERLYDQLAKGDQVYVSGRIETQSWEKDGEKKSKPVLNLQSVRKLAKAEASGNQQRTQQPSRDTGSSWSNAPANSGGWGNGNSDTVPF